MINALNGFWNAFLSGAQVRNTCHRIHALIRGEMGGSFNQDSEMYRPWKAPVTYKARNNEDQSILVRRIQLLEKVKNLRTELMRSSQGKSPRKAGAAPPSSAVESQQRQTDIQITSFIYKELGKEHEFL